MGFGFDGRFKECRCNNAKNCGKINDLRLNIYSPYENYCCYNTQCCIGDNSEKNSGYHSCRDHSNNFTSNNIKYIVKDLVEESNKKINDAYKGPPTFSDIHDTSIQTSGTGPAPKPIPSDPGLGSGIPGFGNKSTKPPHSKPLNTNTDTNTTNADTTDKKAFKEDNSNSSTVINGMSNNTNSDTNTNNTNNNNNSSSGINNNNNNNMGNTSIDNNGLLPSENNPNNGNSIFGIPYSIIISLTVLGMILTTFFFVRKYKKGQENKYIEMEDEDEDPNFQLSLIKDDIKEPAESCEEYLNSLSRLRYMDPMDSMNEADKDNPFKKFNYFKQSPILAPSIVHSHSIDNSTNVTGNLQPIMIDPQFEDPPEQVNRSYSAKYSCNKSYRDSYRKSLCNSHLSVINHGNSPNLKIKTYHENSPIVRSDSFLSTPTTPNGDVSMNLSIVNSLYYNAPQTTVNTSLSEERYQY